MAINLREFEKKLKGHYPHLQFDFKYDGEESEPERVFVNSSIVVPSSFDDKVMLNLTIYQDGFILMKLVFDELEHTLENYLLINDFNNHTAFKGYIDNFQDTSFFIVEFTGTDRTTNDAFLTVTDRISRLLDEDVLKYLKPITVVTK